MRRRLLSLALACAAFGTHAQFTAPPDPDWREAEAPPPPAFNASNAIPLEMPGSSLDFGVAPASVALGDDGIVRYVVVATSRGGAVNGLYEGIRCNTGEFKVYARYNAGSGWVVAKDTPWRSLHDTKLSRHSLLVARSGACIGDAPNQNAAAIVRDLRRPHDSRFNQSQ